MQHNLQRYPQMPYNGQRNNEGNIAVLNAEDEGATNMDSNPRSQYSPDPNKCPSIGVNLRVTGQCSQGGRKYMEDYFSVAYQQTENAKELEYAFIGIYDGHGGGEAATFAKENLMMEIVNQKLFWSDSDQDVLRAIREGYIATHYAMWREQEKWPRTSNGLPSTAGTTATVAFIRREKIYIGHVGDSGIVLGYQNENEDFWRAKQLTVDHKPESPVERKRIARSGGKVIVKSGVPRVVWFRPRNAGHSGPIRRNTPVDEIPFLAVARSLGDLWSYNSALNEFVVSPDPDVKVIRINPKTFRCLIFGTDGLWNVVTPAAAVDIVQEKEHFNSNLYNQQNGGASTSSSLSSNEPILWTNPSKSLVEKALRNWSSRKMRADNTSVVTVILYPTNSDINSRYSSGIQPAAAATNSIEECCGIEYSQASQDMQVYEGNMTYKDMAEKHEPPILYRNFNYYADEDEVADVDPLTPAEIEAVDPINLIKPESLNASYWRNATAPSASIDSRSFDSNGNSDSAWEWNEENVINQVNELNSSGETCVEIAVQGDDDDAFVENFDDEDENIVLVSENEPEDEDSIDEPIEDEDSYIDEYSRYGTNSNSSTPMSIVSADDSNESVEYLNSFAESYNSLLNDQISHDSTASNSNSRYQSITGSNINDLIQEQQLYQQQCMSEEEGYSLTKLETRREQQRCKNGVQTFQIFQQNAAASQNDCDYYISNAANATANTANVASVSNTASASNGTQNQDAFWEQRDGTAYKYVSPESAENQLPNHNQDETDQPPPPPPPPPLELNSLLQREFEEEQQVEYERLQQLENKTDKITAVTTDNNNLVDADDEPFIEEEYLEEELTGEQDDDSVQINEISSSIYDLHETTGYFKVSDTDVNKVEEVEIIVDESVINLSDINYEVTANAVEDPKSSTIVFERLENIEVLHDKPEFVIEAIPSPLPIPAVVLNTLPTKSSYRLRMQKALNHSFHVSSACSSQENSGITTKSHVSLKRSHAQSEYPNVPNENQQATIASNISYPLSKIRKLHTPTSTVTSNSSITEIEKRKLRSYSSDDFSKRTLRTRNSMTKDLKDEKSKGNKVKSPRFSSRRTERTATADHQLVIKNGSKLLTAQTDNSIANNRKRKFHEIEMNKHQQHNQQQTNSVQHLVSTAQSSSSPTTTHMAVESCATPPSAINLRSRQINQLPAARAQTQTAYSPVKTRAHDRLSRSTLTPRNAKYIAENQRNNLDNVVANNTNVMLREQQQQEQQQQEQHQKQQSPNYVSSRSVRTRSIISSTQKRNPDAVTTSTPPTTNRRRTLRRTDADNNNIMNGNSTSLTRSRKKYKP